MSSAQLKPQPQTKTYRLTIKDRQGNTSHLNIEAESPLDANIIAGEQDSKLCCNQYVVLEKASDLFERQIVSVEEV